MREDRLSSLGKFLARLHVWLIAGIWLLCKVLLIAWAALAIYYSNLPWAGLRLGLAIAVSAFAIWGLWLSRHRHMPAAVAVVFLGVVVWWASIAPSHHRNWRPEVAVMPRAIIDGDRVRLTGVRNFDYRTRNDFTVRHEEREVQLSHLVALDFYVSYFMEGPVGHTFLSFIFDNAPPLSISRVRSVFRDGQATASDVGRQPHSAFPGVRRGRSSSLACSFISPAISMAGG
jgi:hypothetical protein